MTQSSYTHTCPGASMEPNGHDARALDLWEVQAELRGAQLMLEAAQRNRQEAQRMLLQVRWQRTK